MQNKAPEVHESTFQHSGPTEVNVAFVFAPIADEIFEEPYRRVVITEVSQASSPQTV